VKSAEDQDSGEQVRSEHPRITSAESATDTRRLAFVCYQTRKCALYPLCVISAIVQINSLVKSEESTFIVATCNKHVTICIF
jgi:hypothetical protein